MTMEGNEFYMNGERLDILQTRWDRAAQEVVYLARDGKGTEWTITLPVLRAVEGREAFFNTGGTVSKGIDLSRIVGEHGPELIDKETLAKYTEGLKSASIDISGYYVPSLYSPPEPDEVVVLDIPVQRPEMAASAYVLPKRELDPTQPDGLETMDSWFRRCFKIEMDGAASEAMSTLQNDVTPAEGSSPAGILASGEVVHRVTGEHMDKTAENDLPQLESDEEGQDVHGVHMDTVTFPLGNDLLQLGFPRVGDEHENVQCTHRSWLEITQVGDRAIREVCESCGYKRERPWDEQQRWEDDGGHAGS